MRVSEVLSRRPGSEVSHQLPRPATGSATATKPVHASSAPPGCAQLHLSVLCHQAERDSVRRRLHTGLQAAGLGPVAVVVQPGARAQTVRIVALLAHQPERCRPLTTLANALADDPAVQQVQLRPHAGAAHTARRP